MPDRDEATTDILIAARSVIAHGLFTTFVLEDDDGNVCAQGACNLVTATIPIIGTKASYWRNIGSPPPAWMALLHDAAVRLYGRGIVHVNNTLGREAVLACFDLAIGPDRLHETDHHADRVPGRSTPALRPKELIE